MKGRIASSCDPLFRVTIMSRIPSIYKPRRAMAAEIPRFGFDLGDLLAAKLKVLPDPKGRPVGVWVEPAATLAFIAPSDDRVDIVIHSLLNHEDTPMEVIEHILIHELIHLRVGSRMIDGKKVRHPPEFWTMERQVSPNAEMAMAWVFRAFPSVLRHDKEEEKIWVKGNWWEVAHGPRSLLLEGQWGWSRP